MSKINVHVLNFHGPVTHIEILLEDTSVAPHTYYIINRWDTPKVAWDVRYQDILSYASSKYSFPIEACPNEITSKWTEYWKETYQSSSILGKNCGVAAQWFLNHFAEIPHPSQSNLSMNHLIFGIFWPSFIPCPVTLPGRIMSNTKFYIEAREHPEKAAQYSKLFLHTSLALSLLLFSSSAFALALTSHMIGVALLTGAVSAYGFFTAYNLLSAKNLTSNIDNTDVDLPVTPALT
ncbi:MAG: hypothetical protein K0U24_00140 [Gammaproteobacteria bacterium]|nr:hypothetical protein [Gammaproteobacteria bacterium]MCH9717615.1 hypothetical protein [Gammaproteobacteria bacterium]MCH9762636.1 hypothetical protein [Gammaproteobacteria bacterium]